MRAGDIAGYVDPEGYRRITVWSKTYYAHRLAWLLVHGEWPDQLDHADLDRDNNAISNLRVADYAQNHANRPCLKTSSLGVKGVERHKSSFRARVRVGGKRISLGTFSTIEEAAIAYEAALRRVHGQFARV